MALVGNILLGTGAAPGMSSIASAYAESAASSRIPWSALDYSGQTITAINGWPIGGQGGGGGVTPADVSAIASAYADEKLDKTASSTFQPSGNYAYQSSLSSYLPGSASSNFAPAGDYAYNSSLSAKLDNSAFSSYSSTVESSISSIENNISSISSIVSGKADASSLHEYSGVGPIVVDNTADTISLSASSIYFDSSMMSYVRGGSGFVGVNSAGMQPAGDYAYRSSLAMYAYNSALSSKLDNSASGTWYPLTGNPSGFLTSSYTPTFGYDGEYKISSIDGSALAGDGGMYYTSPSGTVAIDNVNGTIEIWNSAIAVTEHVTAGQSSYLGSSNDIFTDIYRSGVGKPAIPSGTNILYVVQLLKPLNNPDSAYSLEIRFTGDGAKTSVISATDVHFPSAEGYTGSAMFSSDMNIAALGFHINGSETWYSTASATVSASSIVYPQTAYETSVQELALASQVPSMSAWQSLTAWATAQGWTP